MNITPSTRIIALLACTAAFQACDSGTSSDNDSISSSSTAVDGSSSSNNVSSSSSIAIEYYTDTADVDYKGKNQVVYYDFSSRTKTIVAHDSWHVAFDKDYSFVANGGNYGYGVHACSTGISDFASDFSGWKDSTSRFTRTDTIDNVLAKNWSGGQVFLISDEAGTYYKYQILGTSDKGLRFKIAALAATSAAEDTIAFATGYNRTFINLASHKAVQVEPLANAWDIRFGRTEFLMGGSVSGRSSIAINALGGVQSATISAESEIELSSVTAVPASGFSGTELAPGSSWVSYSSTTKVFTMLPVVYVVKTTEGNYAKFRMINFMGPNNEYYYSLFKFLYQANSATTFSM